MAKIQQNTLEVLASGQQMFPNALHILSEIPPRKGFSTEDMEAERRALNAWMNTLPGGADAIIPIGEVLGDGKRPRAVAPAVPVDGTHWSPAGARWWCRCCSRRWLAALASRRRRRYLYRSAESLQPLVVRCRTVRRTSCTDRSRLAVWRRPPHSRRSEHTAGRATSSRDDKVRARRATKRWEGENALPPAGVADGTRTRDSQDHNLVLYQLNYSHHRRRPVTRRAASSILSRSTAPQPNCFSASPLAGPVRRPPPRYRC